MNTDSSLARLNKFLLNEQVTFFQMLAIEYISRESAKGDTFVSDIARALGRIPSSILPMLEVLIKKKYVKRLPRDPEADQRYIPIILNQRGSDLMIRFKKLNLQTT